MSSGIEIAESVQQPIPGPRVAPVESPCVTKAPGSGRWQRRLSRAVAATDLVIIAAASGIAAAVYSPALAAIGAAVLVGGLVAFRAWERGVLGQGSEEFA